MAVTDRETFEITCPTCGDMPGMRPECEDCQGHGVLPHCRAPESAPRTLDDLENEGTPWWL